MLITIAGLLLGGRSAIYYALLCTLAGSTLLLLENQGLITPGPETRTRLAMFGGVTPNFVSISILVYVFHRSFLQALERVRRNEQELAQSNRELDTIRATLEDQVAERTFRAEQARQEAEAAKQALELRIWKATGQAELNKITRGEQNLTGLAHNIVAGLCHYLQLPVGLLFIRQENTLTTIGRYAFESANGVVQFKLGEGVVGQAAVDQELLILDKPPAPTNLPISSGLGQVQPDYIVVLPLVFEGVTIAVLELGSWRPLTITETEFLQEMNDNLAAAIRSAQTQSQVNRLLRETT
jgi:putative methionine-R-sulfoxide reductase with GAF domain